MPFWALKDSTSSGFVQLVVICAVVPVRFALSTSLTVIVASIAVAAVNLSEQELDQIKGLHTSKIEKVLGYKAYDEVIHRDDLVVLVD